MPDYDHTQSGTVLRAVLGSLAVAAAVIAVPIAVTVTACALLGALAVSAQPVPFSFKKNHKLREVLAWGMRIRNKVILIIWFLVAGGGNQFVVAGEELGKESSIVLPFSEKAVSFEELEVIQPGSNLELSEKHSVEAEKSLLWKWENNKDSLVINTTFPDPPHLKNKVFSIWIYSDKQSDNKLRFQFTNQKQTIALFDFKLNFRGWRWANIPYEAFDALSGQIDLLKISSCLDQPGKVFFDSLWINRTANARFCLPDYHHSFKTTIELLKRHRRIDSLHINEPSQQHLLKQAADEEAVNQIHALKAKILERSKTSYNEVQAQRALVFFDDLRITKDEKGIGGTHVLSTVDRLPGVKIKIYLINLLLLAQQAQAAPEGEMKEQLINKYLLATEHLFDQGFQEGSSLSCSALMGYFVRRWPPGILLMEKELREANLFYKSVMTVVWHGRSFLDFTKPLAELDDEMRYETHRRAADYLNTFSKTQLLCLLLLDDNRFKIKALQGLKKTIEEIILFENGVFKNDGATYHHGMHYFGYGIPALNNVSGVIRDMSGTFFEISQEAYDRLKKVLLKTELWAYPHAGPIATGRHPLINSYNFERSSLALPLLEAASDTKEIDRDLLDFYLRTTPKVKETFESYPRPLKLKGFWAMNYVAAGIYKTGLYSVQMKGYNKAVASYESSRVDNRYGRYLGYGSCFIFQNNTRHTSGYKHDGWNWALIPGTTSLLLPPERIEGSRKSSKGMRPPQKTLFSGSSHFDNELGVFAFKTEGGRHDQSISVNQTILAVGNTLICLGSNINNISNQYSTVTTLFQRGLSSLDTSLVSSNLKCQSEGVFKDSVKLTEDTWLIDPFDVGYFIPKQTSCSLYVEKQEQISLHNKERTETKGDFVSAYLGYGIAPENQTYEYTVLLGADSGMMGSFNSKKNLYRILQQDKTAHIITVPGEQITAYTIFSDDNLGIDIEDQELLSSDPHLIIIMKQVNPETIRCSVSYPQVVKRIKDQKIDEGINKIKFKGEYLIVNSTRKCKSVVKDGNTIVTVTVLDAVPTHFSLRKM